MADSDPIARRTIVRAVGLAASTAALAGCIDESTVDDPDGSTGEGAQPSDDGADEDASDDADDAPLEIELYGNTGGWEGLAPASIKGVENPTLHLEPGATYRLGWTDGDGAAHNIEIRNGDGEVVDDLATDVTDEPRDDQLLAFEASEEMAGYVCDPHQSIMRGEIRVEGGSSD